MTQEKIHFLYQKGKDGVDSFAQSLIHDLKQTPLSKATMIVAVGGDGQLLEAFRRANGRKVYGITPPSSNSRGFWTDHEVSNTKDLLERIERARCILISPLKGKINFSKGTVKEIAAFNDIMIERVSAQSVLFNLTATFGNQTAAPQRIMAGGFIFSTSYGSTGGSKGYGGSVLPIDINAILLTGKGVTDPPVMHPVMVGMDGTHFHVDFSGTDKKRPIRIDYDGHSIHGSSRNGNIVSLDISAAPESAVHFLTMYNPDIRAFASITPK